MNYIPFGSKGGMIVSKADAEDKPIQDCRSCPCWVQDDGSLEIFSWKGGNTILLPWNIYMNLCQKVKEGESLVKQILRIYGIKFE